MTWRKALLIGCWLVLAFSIYGKTGAQSFGAVMQGELKDVFFLIAISAALWGK